MLPFSSNPSNYFHQTCDSEFYESSFSQPSVGLNGGSICGGPSSSVAATTDLSVSDFRMFDLVDTKHDRYLYTWYMTYGYGQPNDKELHCLEGLVGACDEAIRDWFRIVIATGNLPSRSHHPMKSGILFEYGNATEPTDPSSTDPAIKAVPQSIANESTAVLPYEQKPGLQSDGDIISESYASQNTSVKDHNVLSSFECQVLSLTTQASHSEHHGRTCRPALSDSLRRMVEDVEAQRTQRGCAPNRSHHRGTGRYQCTINCGKSFSTVHDWARHEECAHPQSFWFCYRCGKPETAPKNFLYIRDDKFREYVGNYHTDWMVAEALSFCRLNY